MAALKNGQVIVTGGVPVLAKTTPPLASAEVLASRRDIRPLRLRAAICYGRPIVIHGPTRMIDVLPTTAAEPRLEPPRVQRRARVALVNMPFAAAARPSIQCGLLKAGVARRGHDVHVHYLNLELASAIGHELYSRLSDLRTEMLLGEWLFSYGAFGSVGDVDGYRASVPNIDEVCREFGFDFDELSRMRIELFPSVLDRWCTSVDWSQYRAVGFTSTFEQNVAALGLARRIKHAHPDVSIIFGGANFDGEMGVEYVRAFDWIDYAVIGEGDRALPDLIDALASDRDVDLPGVVGREDAPSVRTSPAPSLIRDMDSIPDPDYDDYFATLGRLGRDKVLGTAIPLLLIETARGCWWGEKHHCTFCGLNAQGMAFRSKSSERVLSEMRRLSGKYRIANFESVDNIMDMHYLEEVLGPIASEQLDYELFYEVKANLDRKQLRALAKGGVRTIQPGIESLSTHVLKLMRKGSNLLLNVRVMKWAHYYGMRVAWNLIHGFPGETLDDYERQADLIPLLVHLPPPAGGGRIWLERFSPYFTDPDFAARDVRPWEVYRHVYPEAEIDIAKIAYFFSYRFEDVVPRESLARFFEAMDDWQDSWKAGRRPILVYRRAPDWIQIMDKRRMDAPAAHAFSGWEAAAYEICGETDRTPKRVVTMLAEQGHEIPLDDVQALLARFCDTGLMVEDGGHYLSLALPANGNW